MGEGEKESESESARDKSFWSGNQRFKATKAMFSAWVLHLGNYNFPSFLKYYTYLPSRIVLPPFFGVYGFMVGFWALFLRWWDQPGEGKQEQSTYSLEAR